jgi:glycosyltransferase involved in cell wall biosynthesis
MHIMLVNVAPIPVFAYGGTERVVWDLGLALTELGHEVSFLVPAGSSCPFAHIQFIDPTKSWAAQIPAGVDVVHFQFHPGSEPDRPYLVTEHGNGQIGTSLLRNTVFVSGSHAARHGSDQFVLNGLDWRNYQVPNWETKRIHTHFLGKAAWRVKNVRGAIDVAALAHTPIAVLGGSRVNVKIRRRFTLSRHARFYGMVGGSTKFNLLNQSNGLIFPVTWHEPFGLAVIESLFYGCPVFATPYGALPELVDSSVGVLSSSLHTLSEAVKEHLDNHTFTAATCHERAVNCFSAVQMAANYVVKYNLIADGHMLHALPPCGLQHAASGLSWG